MKEYHVCHKCEINHYENCGTCFGFGVYYAENSCIPVSASIAHNKNTEGRPEISGCPECGSTDNGISELDVVSA